MNWSDLGKKIKQLLSKPDKKEWLEELVRNVEYHHKENKSLGFKIIKTKENGFVVKVSGLFAFIFFNHMPWQYNHPRAWQTAAPLLIGKVLFCKIHKITKNPLSIIIDGNVDQFAEMELYEGEEYTGLVIHKAQYGVFLDIGYHFEWKCGSSVGLLHKSQFLNPTAFNKCQPGSELQTKYQGLNANGQLILGDKCEFLDWMLGKPQELLGQLIWAKVKKDVVNHKTKFLVKGQYAGTIVISGKIYPKHQVRNIRNKMNELDDGEIISCEVIGCNEKRKVLNLKWIMEFDENSLSDVALMNLIDNETLEKLKLLRTRN